jgi:NAD(P)-dependent dehydrogenase (short-subunit alcohol dehydrogenase family)
MIEGGSNMGRLGGKTAIITGATSGIGEAAVGLFAEEGAEVVFAGRRKELGEPIEERLRGQGYDVKFVATDIKNDPDLEKLVKTAIDTYGKIDILFNNAGISIYRSFIDMPLETADDILDTNYRSMYRLTRLVVPYMVEQGKGVIVNTSSIGGLSGAPDLVSYAGSKGAVRLFTKGLAAELGPLGIRANSLHPGLTVTEMTLKKEGMIEGISAHIPLRRGGTPRELAYAALFLAGDESAYMTGAELVVDGGAFGCV